MAISWFGSCLLSGDCRAGVALHILTKSCSQNQQFLRRSFPDRGERNAAIKSNEPSFMLNRESKQVYVGQLPRSMNSGRVHDIRIQQTDFIGPEFMDILVAGRGYRRNS